MKTLFIGGVKSGKSRLAESYILKNSQDDKPYYLATTEFIDVEMELSAVIPNNLMPYVGQVAYGQHAQLNVFGNDYSTTPVLLFSLSI